MLAHERDFWTMSWKRETANNRQGLLWPSPLLWLKVADSMEDESAVVHPPQTHAAETDARTPARVIGKDDLVGWQGHSGLAPSSKTTNVPGGPF